MQTPVSRRTFIARTTAAACAASLSPLAPKAAEESAATGFDFPLVDFHVHLDNSTIDKALELSRERGIKFGIVEHAGTKENQYPRVLSDDEELLGQLKMLEGKPVFKGVQAEWTDWMNCFSPKALAQLDYTLTDAMTFPGKDGQRVKLWDKDAEARVDMADKQKFMDRFVGWHVEIISKQPIDIFANTSWLPASMAGDYELYWTPERVKKVVQAAVEHRVALEISSGMKLPKLSFLQIAKAARVKFSFGSNGRYPNMGKLEYSLEMARALKLTRADMFTPAPEGQKAVQRWERTRPQVPR
jgi:histidinol phosphatase-like PHP family hydrolase